ncbi:collagen binding domain-containing protein [Paenibacillus sp. NPDC056579]|uniref:collagen binding domain-containing protein n=1 Tax=Paenibacillus sp. NPDC056579 TaxID=3345871 RepID=UPI0036740184
MVKKISTLLASLMLMVQVMYAVGLSPQANAAAIPGSIINSVTMTVYDKSGQVVTETVYEQGAKVQLDYTWSLPNGHPYKNGDTFTFKVPEQFKFYNDIPEQPLLSGGGEAIGKFKLNKDRHEVVMTLQTIEHLVDVQGTLTFLTEFDTQVIHGSTTQIIKIPVSSGEQVFTLHFRPNVTSAIAKSGVPKGYNAKSIDWEVDVNKDLSVIQNAVVTDPIPAGLGSPVTVAVYELNMNLDGIAAPGAPLAAGKYSVSTAGNLLTVSFTDSPIRSAYRIQYETPIADEDKPIFENTATLQGSDRQPVSATASVKVQRGAALDKSSTKYDSFTQTIDWEIKYNYNEKTIVQANAYVTDLFNDTQKLVDHSIHVYPVTIGSNGSQTVGAELAASQYTVSPATGTGTAGFKLQFHTSITSAYLIKYQTKAVDRVLDNSVVTNKVTSGSGDNKTATRPMIQVVIGKSAGAVNYAAKTVDWTIAINRDSQPMSDVVVADTFPNKGLRLVPGSLVVKEGSNPMPASDYTVDPAIPADQGFKVSFNKALNSSVTITFQTEFHLDWLVGSGTNFPNHASIAWTDSASKPQAKTVSAAFDPRVEVKNNGFKNGVYNASSKQITWTIGVNYNGKPLAEAIVDDTLESGQKLVDNSLAVYNMTIPANGSPALGSVVDSTYYSYAVNENNKLVVTFLKPISAPYTVVFATSLDGKLIGDKVNNTADFFDGATAVSKPLTASVTIPNGGEYVNKSGQQTGNKIAWTVAINRGQSTVADAKLIDTPSDNQLLLPDTFKLYTTVVNAGGTVTKGAELIKGTDYSLDFRTDSDGKQSFELSFLKVLSTSAILEYQSLIVANDKDAVSNQIAFSGNNEITVTKDTTNTIVVGVSSGSGTISGIRGSLTVTKVDGSDHTVRLGGATFELYRKSGSEKLLISTLTTDASGTAEFKKLLAGDYVVKEVAAPEGYILDSKEYSVPIQSASGFQITVSNTKSSNPKPPVIEGSLTIRKIDSAQSELLLSGAVFELFRKQDPGLNRIGTATTDAGGTATFSKLAVGDYVVKETAAPAGYVLDSKEYPVTIQSTGNIQLTVANTKTDTPKPPVTVGSLTIRKVDSAQSELVLSGAVFELFRKQDSGLNRIGAATTDATGTAVFDKLPAGDYVVKETMAPTGYVLDSKEYPVTIQTANGSKLTVTNLKLPDTSNPGSTDSSGSSDSPDSPSTPVPVPTPGAVPPTDPKQPEKETIIDGDIKVPLGPPPVVKPENGQDTAQPGQPETNHPEIIVDVEPQEVPLGSPQPDTGAPAATLPKTGQSSPVYVQAAGIALILLGFMLRRKWLKNS